MGLLGWLGRWLLFIKGWRLVGVTFLSRTTLISLGKASDHFHHFRDIPDHPNPNSPLALN